MYTIFINHSSIKVKNIYTHIRRKCDIYIYDKFSIKKEGNPAICDNMGGPGGYYAKWNVKHKKTNTVWSHLYAESKNGTLILTGPDGWKKPGDIGQKLQSFIYARTEKFWSSTTHSTHS